MGWLEFLKWLIGKAIVQGPLDRSYIKDVRFREKVRASEQLLRRVSGLVVLQK